MPVAGLTSGIDTKIVFTDKNGVQSYQLLESFTSKEDAVISKEVQINGRVRHPKFHQGWSGSFVLERNGAFMDAYIASQESGYYLGVDQVPITITQTIQESDGTVSQWQYLDVVIMLDNAGTYSGNEIVKQSATFSSSEKKNLDQAPIT